MRDNFVLIDGNSLINRAYYAMQKPMITKDGIYTHAIFGFINMLSRIEKEYEPSHMAVAFDRSAPTFRHEQYAEYKAGRRKMPPELAMQLPLLKEVLSAMRIKQVEEDGWEADDIIGTLALKAEAAGFDPLIITGDKDQLQLATDKTQIVFTRKGVSEFDIYDHDAMVEKYGFTPRQFIDFKGLMGDPSDNIPGLPGVGEKTATKLLLQFGSVENLLAHTDEIENEKLREKVEENAATAVMSKRLATIVTTAPVPEDMDEYIFREPDNEALAAIYVKLEFNSFLRRMNVAPQAVAPRAAAEPLSAVLGKDEIVLRVFSDFSHVKKPSVYGIAYMEGEEYKYLDGSDAKAVAAFIKSLTGKKLLGHQLIDAYYVLANQTEEPEDALATFETAFDTAIGAYVLQAGRSTYDLKTLSFEYLGKEILSEKEFMAGSAQLSLLEDPSAKFADYGKLCCETILALRGALEAEISSQSLENVLRDLELPLVRVMAAMEIEGFKVDAAVLKEIAANLSVRVEELRSEICERAGEDFNVNSTQQLGVILFEKLGLPAEKKTKKGYSTSAEVLEKLRGEDPIIDLILEYRKLTKLYSTYAEGLGAFIHEDGRIHPHFQQTVTATGRISCTDPNLQNIPVRDELGRTIRKAFVASDGKVLVGADYSQIELRVLAHMSGEPVLIDAFNSGADIHRATAARVFGLKEEEVTGKERSAAKAVNFGVIYGMSGFGLASELGISRKKAENYINDYFEKHKRVKAFMDERVAEAKEKGYAVTLFGRRRYIPEIKSNQYMVRQLGERLAMNTPIQGSAADIIKLAMIRTWGALRKAGLRSRLILQIHDELIIETYRDEEEAVRAVLTESMEKAVDLAVKLTVDVNTGSDWYMLK